jgi:hypothetical protein
MLCKTVFYIMKNNFSKKKLELSLGTLSFRLSCI